MGNMGNKRGFSGLLSLTSDIGVLQVLPVGLDQSASEKTDLEQKSPSNDIAILPDQDKHPGTGSNKSYGAIVFVCVLIAVVIYVFKSSTTLPTTPSNTTANYQQNRSAQTASVSTTPQSVELQYTKPQPGSSNVLSVQEIRWCIRSGIEIDATRTHINSQLAADRFNMAVNDHNTRCGSYSYRRGDQERAERDVEPYRSMIAAEAISRARLWR